MPDLDAATDRLVAHLDRLYAFAQTITLDADQAAALVEATYQRAFATPPAGRPTDDLRGWLYRLMAEVRAEQQHAPIEAAPPDQAPLPSPASQTFHRRLLQRFLERRLPAALTAVPASERLLLHLCDIESLSCADAGRVLGLEPDEACARLEAARAGLLETLKGEASGLERALLDRSLPPDWTRSALRHVAQFEFTPPPRALHESVRATANAPALPAATTLPVPVVPVVEPEEAPARWGRRVGLAAVLLLAATLAVFGVLEWLDRPPETDLITLSAQQAGDTPVLIRVQGPEQAEAFLYEQFGRRVSVPAIEGAALAGLGLGEVVEGVEVPLLRYNDADAETPIVVFLYSYAVLDRFEGRLTLAGDVRQQIEDPGHIDLFDLGRDKVLVWRHRDDIYLAVTEGPAQELAARISID